VGETVDSILRNQEDEKMENFLYYGDNLDILKRYIEDEIVDLVYLDPPFKSQQDYNVLFAERNGSQAAAQIKAFEDTWHWDQVAARAYEEVVVSGGRVAETMEALKKLLDSSDMMAYLSMMAPRLIELKRVMKQTASIYLHCDPTASHYLKVLMDGIFGPENFQNEIVWKRTSSHSGEGEVKRFGRVHDTILFYSRNERFLFNRQYQPYDEKYLTNFYKFKDSDGRRYRLGDLTGAGIRKGETGQSWMGINPTEKGRHWMRPPSDLEELNRQGRIIWPKKEGGVPAYKRYLDEMEGVLLQDIWTDLRPISSQATERLGYPTQKPESLLDRIICVSSKEGDLVLDPFCGCGTTVSVAEKLGRRWIGIDVTHLAITLMRHRLKDAFGDNVKYKVIGEPVSLPDAETLAQQDPYQFQWWALGLVGARPVEQKKGADKGIDGRLYFFVEGKAEQIIFSVKAGNITSAHVRDLHGVVDREKAAIGVLISLNSPTQQMRAEAADAGFYASRELGSPKYPKVQLLTIEELLNGKKIDCPHSARREDTPAFKRAPKAIKQSKNKQSKVSEYGYPPSG
jgi:DNA modification methylase